MSLIKFATPEISSHFDKGLLSKPFKIGDDLETLEKIYQYITEKLIKKTCYSEKSKVKCENLLKEFIDLYERAKIQKEIAEKKGKNKTQKPFYFIECSNRCNKSIFKGLRERAV